MEILDKKDKNWREVFILMFDHSKTHIGSYTTEFLSQHQIPFLLSGVAGFEAVPVEKIFALVKTRFRYLVE